MIKDFPLDVDRVINQGSGAGEFGIKARCRPMTKNSTILGHLAGWGLSRRFEDAATEGLAYMLDYEPARHQFINMLRQAQPKLPTDLSFGTQHTAENSRPDMVGQSSGKVRLFIENKFGAELTDNQPVTYLEQLADTKKPSLLLFIAPEQRTRSLWREVDERVRSSQFGKRKDTDRQCPAPFKELWTLEGGCKIGLTTWSAVLEELRRALAEDSRGLADLSQLEDLCNTADVNENSPHTWADLGDERVPTRILQYGRIVQDAINSAPSELLHTKNLRYSHDWTGCGRYFQFEGDNAPGAWLGFDFERWRKYAENGGPLWVCFAGEDFGKPAQVRGALEEWARKRSRPIEVSAENQSVWVPIAIPVGREHKPVVQSVVDELWCLRNQIIAWLGSTT